MAHSNLDNTDAIYAEYPFLEKIIKRKYVDKAQVRRWDDELLSKQASFDTLYFLDKEGNVVDKIREPSLWNVWWNEGHSYTDTVGQRLAKMGDAKARRICYAFGRDFPVALFYKLPKEYRNAADWLKAKVARDRREIRDI
jgi:hypothetical protein